MDREAFALGKLLLMIKTLSILVIGATVEEFSQIKEYLPDFDCRYIQLNEQYISVILYTEAADLIIIYAGGL